MSDTEKAAAGKGKSRPGAQKKRAHLGAVLPASGEHDSAHVWGDSWSNEERLRAEVPPHFGKI